MTGLRGMGNVKSVNIDTSEETSDTNVDDNDNAECGHAANMQQRVVRGVSTPKGSRGTHMVWPGPHSAGSRRPDRKDNQGAKSSRDSGMKDNSWSMISTLDFTSTTG